MTLYPNLVIGLCLFFLTIFSFRRWNRYEKLFGLFLVLWMVVSTLQSFLLKDLHADAIFDLRSLGLQIITAYLLFGSRNRLGNKRFSEILRTGVNMYTVLLFVSGTIEWLTTLHFEGTMTKFLARLPADHIELNAPMFIYDNMNDFMLHIIFFFILTLILNPRFRENLFAVIGGWILIYVFAYFSMSRFGIWISSAAICIQLFSILYSAFKRNSSRGALPYIIILLLFAVTIMQNPIFIGPKFSKKKDQKATKTTAVKVENDSASATPTNYLPDSAELKKPEVHPENPVASAELLSSFHVRTNLILNGLTLIKSAPVAGVGAGNYRVFSREHKDLLFTGTVDSAHCLPIEIISEFGISAWIYFIIILVLFIRLFKLYSSKLRHTYWLFFLFLALPAMWCMPSSYLYLETHRLLVPILIFFLIYPVFPEITKINEAEK